MAGLINKRSIPVISILFLKYASPFSLNTLKTRKTKNLNRMVRKNLINQEKDSTLNLSFKLILLL